MLNSEIIEVIFSMTLGFGLWLGITFFIMWIEKQYNKFKRA